MSSGLDSATSRLEKLGSSMTRIGAGMTAAITAPLVAIGAAGVKMSMELETAMTNIQSITKQSDGEIEGLRQQFLEMSTDLTKTTDSAQKLSEAFYDVVGSGFEGADAMKVLEAATMAASAGLTDTQVAVQGMTAVINAYGLSADEAAHVSDLMFQTVNRGVGTFEQLSSSMSNVVGMANAAGVPFDTVSAAIATMSKQGMSFAESSVSLNAALSDLIKPTSDGAAMIAAMGYESGEAMLQTLGLAGTLQAVQEHTGGSVTEMSKLFSSIRGLRGALALTGDGAAMFAEDMAAMSSANGAAGEAFAIQTQSFEATLKNFQNTLGVMLIAIGDAIKPVLTAIMQFLTPLMNAFIALPAPVKTVIVAFLALLAAIGPILLIAGQLIAAWTAVSGALAAFGGIAGIVTTAMSAVGVAIAAITSPIGLAIIAIGALAVAFDKISGGKVAAIPQVWGENFRMLGEIISLATQKAVNWGANFIGGFIQGMKQKLVEAVKVVLDLAAKVTNGIKNALKIKSPSRVMMGLGEQVVAGFNAGIDTMGGIGVQVPALAGAGAGVSSAPSTGSGGLSGGNVYIQTLNVPPGTSKEQIDFIMAEIGRQVKRRGGIG